MKDYTITRTELITVLEKCFIELYTNDDYLIAHKPAMPSSYDEHLCERTIVFRFAYYLQKYLENNNLLNKLVVDCDYNRDAYDIKSVGRFVNGTYPDVIVHQRGNNKHNFLVIEFKTYWNRDVQNDIDKITGFLVEYDYKYVMSIILEKTLQETLLQINDHLWDQSILEKHESL
ncbi:hypothetical protein [Beduini massiliensis]|uniref:hypothetical protein n=1 Tax=Beduini massiliensis TaxID=1585974 RepID=UPI000694E08A|nr:hypothetical protein [Beduini massiliensis]